MLSEIYLSSGPISKLFKAQGIQLCIQSNYHLEPKYIRKWRYNYHLNSNHTKAFVYLLLFWGGIFYSET